MLYALAGLATISSGQVLWGDKALAQLGEEARARFRRQSLGLIFQDFLLFEELDALANATIATGYVEARSRADLRRGASAMLERLRIPQTGGRTIASFSGASGRGSPSRGALAHDPAVILADEPTASLDRATADQLIDDLIALVRDQNKTLIVVSHDLHLHERMDQVIEIVDGRMTGEVRNDDLLYWLTGSWDRLPPDAQDAVSLLLYLLPSLLIGFFVVRGMRPMPLVRAMLWQFRWSNLVFVLLIAVSIALGVGLIAQERGLRRGTAKAADKFELIIAAPGSEVTNVMATVYLQASDMPLLDGTIYNAVANHEQVDFAAPIAFGDSFKGSPVVGTTADLS